MTVLEEVSMGNVYSVLSLTANQHTIVAAHENGSIKVWSNDVLMKSMQTHNGSILSICMEGKWLFTGGWDKTVSVQELMVNEFHVDAMAYWFNILWFCRNSFVLLARKAFCWIC
ncbi:uncharacterized protein LOC116140160 [Pistacia vera]|uniref:uncharacterized protein LOC116140160 n=1 Tax=Pistacia vera TaxID=55513 RepID=UPI001262E07D|nr:uncharacterized protein LOC116140160 [Pistacia vera]